jgi:flagellar protein FlaJ
MEVKNLLFLLFLFAALLALGLFFLLTGLLKLPTLNAARAMINSGKRKKKSAGSIEARLMGGAVKLSKYIRMDEYKKTRMQYTLKAAGIPMTPETYTAYAIVKAGAVLFGVIPCLLILPLLAPVIVFLAVLVYFRETRQADEKLKEKRDEIESELPRFVATIEQELKNSRDVLSIIENFKKNAGATFADELGVLTADMRSSSYEAALTRFEARLNSPQVSNIVRGLIGVLRGDDSAVYFQMLAHDFKQLELQRLNKKAQKIPPKIRVLSLVMLLCFLLTYLAVIAVQVMQSLSVMF